MKTWKHNEEAQRCSEFNYQRSNAYFESKAFLHGAVNCFDTYRLMNSYESSELRFAFQGHLMQMRLQVQRWNYIICQEDMRNGQMLNSNCCGELPRLAIAFFAAFTGCINWPFETNFSVCHSRQTTNWLNFWWKTYFLVVINVFNASTPFLAWMLDQMPCRLPFGFEHRLPCTQT